MTHPLQAVLFDMDGTLVDTEESWWQAVEGVAAGLGHELGDADVTEVLGRAVEHTAAHLARTTGTATPVAELARDLHRDFAARVAARAVPRPGALELLDELARHRIPVALVTASPRDVVEMVLDVLGRERFAVCLTADDTARTKPAPDPYLAATRALDVEPAACVAVEDTPTGVASAEAAGCRVLAVPSLAPIAPGAGRTVLRSLEQADVTLLHELVSRAPAFLVPAFTTRRVHVGEPFQATVAGLLRGAPVTYTKAGGPAWARVRADGGIIGVPDTAGESAVTVTATDGEGRTATITVRVPVVAEDEPRVRELRVMSWNLWDGGTQVDDYRDKQLKILLESDVDVVGLQEAHAHSAKELAEALGWEYHQGGDNLGIISRYPLVARHGVPATALHVAISATVRLDPGSDVTVWSAHLNWTPYGPYDAIHDRQPVEVLVERESAAGRLGEIQEILRAMGDDLAARDTTPVLLVGDFNVPSHLDWTDETAPLHGGYGPVPWPVTLAAEEAGLRDSYREAHPDPVRAPGATWSPVTPAPEPQDRIDYVFYAGRGLRVRDSMTHVTGEPRPEPDVAGNTWPSDHAAVITTFTLR
ncbi:HAD-IA family hydrolase [Nonomuraea sediminis]|uniref:HAD-IA family hydrolase n=1 Tax=Nonomuraea sediminis TaxID=2835864 RepID=UPI001BDBD6EC|nr:HAD-IA family hydrolase [Nonomuraea sediminis]